MAAAYFLNNNKNSKNPKVQKLIEDLKNGKSFFEEDYQNPFLNQLNDSLKDESQKKFTNTQTNLGIKAK